MLVEIFNVIAPVLVCALIGFVWKKQGHEYPSEFVSKLVFNVGAPCLVVSSISGVALDMDALLSMTLATILCLVLVSLVAWIVIRVSGHDVRALIVSMAFPNVGNMGLPLALFAFGEEGLALAVAYFMVISIAHFSIGMAIASGEAIRFSHFVRNPILWSICVAVGLVSFSLSLPTWMASSFKLIGDMTIPLMLITLGVSLAGIQVKQWTLGIGYSLLRIGLGGLIALLVAWSLDLKGLERAVLIMQGIMPVAVFNYLFALKSGKHVDTVASLVMISTVMSIVLLPFVLGQLM